QVQVLAPVLVFPAVDQAQLGRLFQLDQEGALRGGGAVFRNVADVSFRGSPPRGRFPAVDFRARRSIFLIPIRVVLITGAVFGRRRRRQVGPVLRVPGVEQVEVADALDPLDAGLGNLLRVWRLVIGTGVVRRYGRAVGIRRVGKARPRVGVDVERVDLPKR